ncbi:MAG TPA: hypothetical protein PKW90_11355 [Myxococcota bacterium]|nr:hypothetical protein [Myxococcota bacterium]
MLLIFAWMACTGSTKESTTDDSGGQDSSSTDDSGSSDVRSFENCGTSVADDVPEFYQKYFLCSTISMDNGDVVVVTQNLPPYKTYYYGEGNPNYAEWDDRGGAYHPNPSTLAAGTISMRVPSNPVSKGLTINDSLVDLQAETSDEEYNLGPAGVSPDSVAMFNSVAAPGDDILQEEFTFDEWGSHPAGTEYHHHGANAGALAALQYSGLVSSITPGSSEPEVYGIMCDGTVLLGCLELDGSTVSGSLDAQNGHVGDIKEGSTTHFSGRYHIHMCADLGHYGLSPEIQAYQDCGIARGR